VRYAVAAVLVALGGLLVVAGEKDDSPGLGGIGLLVAVGTIVWLVRRHRASSPD
jgi:hypothetical protein